MPVDTLSGARNSPLEKDKDIAPDSPLRKLIKIFRTNTALKFHAQGAGGNNKPIGTAKVFFKNAFNLNSIVPTMSIYDRYARYCLTGDTLIATNNEQGYLRLDEVVEKFNRGEEVVVFAWDKHNQKTTSQIISNAKATKIDIIWEVELDNGCIIRGTGNHPFMLRDGSYCEIQNLQAGVALMPFNRITVQNHYRNKNSSYRYICDTKYGRRPEHRIIAQMYHGPIDGQTHHVHHKDFNGINNLKENLEVMTVEAHRALHNHLNKVKWAQPGAHEEMSEFTKKRWKEGGDLREGLEARTEKLRSSGHYDKVTDLLVERNKKNKYGQFNKGRTDQKGSQNANAYDNITFQTICNIYKPGMSCKLMAETLKVDRRVIRTRLEWEGYKNWPEFVEKYQNHKVVSVRKTDKTEQVYDLTVPQYHNFALVALDAQNILSNCIYVSNSDYMEMDSHPIISKALDIYADESTQKDEDGKIIKVVSEDKEIKEILTELFDEIIHLNGREIFKLVRYLCKYGDVFYLIDALENEGVVGLILVPANEIEREEGFDKEEPTAVRFRWATRSNMEIPNAYIAHFRLDGNDQFVPFGQAVLEAARRPWRQLVLMTDHMLAYRVIRTPERRVYYLDMMGVPPENEDEVVNKFNMTLKKNKVVDDNGKIDLRFGAAQTVEEDLIVAVRGGDSGTRIETLPGGQNTTEINDIEFIQKNLFAALGIPKAFLTYDESTGSKQTLSMEDIRFARTIGRVQECVIHELLKIGLIHLYLKGYRGKDLFNFKLRMTNPSTTAELQKNELWRARMDLVQAAGDGVFDTNFIYKNFLHLTDEAIDLIRKGQIQDKIFQSKLLSIESQGGMSNMAGGMGGMGGLGGGGTFGGGAGGGLGGLLGGGAPGGLGGPEALGGAGIASNMGAEGGAPPNMGGLPPVPESLNPAAKLYDKSGGKDLTRRNSEERIAAKRGIDGISDINTAEDMADSGNVVDIDGVRRTISSPLGMEESLKESLNAYSQLNKLYSQNGANNVFDNMSAHFSFLRPTTISARQCESTRESWLEAQFGANAGLSNSESNIKSIHKILKESAIPQETENPMSIFEEKWATQDQEIDIELEKI